MTRFLLLALLLLGQPALAEVYTYIDEEGNRVFTDQPKPGNAKRLEIAPAPNTMNAPKDIQPPPLYPKPIPREQGYQVLRILVPEPDATIRDGEGNLIVSAMSEPGLRDNHSYRLLLDGQPVGDPGRSPVFPLKNLDRGTHQLAVEIIDEQGRVVGVNYAGNDLEDYNYAIAREQVLEVLDRMTAGESVLSLGINAEALRSCEFDPAAPPRYDAKTKLPEGFDPEAAGWKKIE